MITVLKIFLKIVISVMHYTAFPIIAAAKMLLFPSYILYAAYLALDTGVSYRQHLSGLMRGFVLNLKDHMLIW